MTIKLKIEKEYDVDTIHVSAESRYWEDGTVNGVEDTDGNIPCRNGSQWQPIIQVETGRITNWQQGVTASVHYKVCDEGTYTLKDKDGKEIITNDGYVPSCLCPNESGYGDYIIMNIDENGMIENFKFKPSDFTQDDN